MTTLVLLLAAQLQLATVGGLVVDASGAPLEGAAITLEDPLGSIVDSRAADTSGRFSFRNVAPGRYTLRASLPGFGTLTRPLNIQSALTVDVNFRLEVAPMSIVDVVLGVEPVTPSSRVSVGGPSIEQVPVRAISKGVQDVVATMPGWATEDNGLLHARGIDDGFLYVIDGVPVYERLDQLSGLGPDVSTIESLNVVTGYVPAEFGYKAGGVISVRSKSSASRWAGMGEIGQGTEHATSGAATAGGPLGHGVMLTAGTSAQRSDRFLDPIDPDNFHNSGDAVSGTGQVTWLHRDADILSIGLGSGRTSFEVPNTFAQDNKGQDQRQRITQRYGQASWQRAWTSSTLTQVSAYARRSESRLEGSADDTPLFANADRSLQRAGVMAALTRRAGSHTLKAGGEIQRLRMNESFLFYVTDEDSAEAAGFSGEALEFNERHPFDFSGAATPRMWSVFVQDEWTAGSALTLSAGVRFDSSELLLSRHQWSPRLGLAYRVGDNTVIRGSASRFFQPPQPENLLLSSSSEARELSPFAEDGGSGGAEVEPERQWAFEAGVAQRLGLLMTLDAAFWYRNIEQVADPNVFAGTTIIFPNAVATGRARGFDVRLEFARLQSWSGYANASVGHVRQTGPITGGLFLEDDIEEIGEGVEFIPDHDQALVASAGVSWSPKRPSVTISGAIRYETGTPIERGDEAEEELRARPGAEMVDFDRGRVKPRTVASIQADLLFWKSGTRSAALRAGVLNLFDADYAYNFGNPFSGTHFGAPLTASIGLRVRF